MRLSRKAIRRFAAVVVVAAAAGMWACSAYYTGPATEHFDGSTFTNPTSSNRIWTDFWRWQFTREREAWPERVDNPADGKPPSRVEGEQLLVTFVGHATVLLQTGGLNIITDPIWSERASPLSWAGPKRVRPPGVAFDDLPRIDVVVISHNHYDHFDLPTLEMLWKRDRPRIIVPLGNDVILKDAIEGIEVTTLDWKQSAEIGPGMRVTAVPVQHWSQRGAFDRNRALWAGYVIDAPGGAVFFAGDTGLGDGWWIEHVKAVAPRLRLALLPIGAYTPRWFMAYQHIDPEEAVAIFEQLNAQAALGIHFGTFAMADDGFDSPPKALRAALEARNIDAGRFRALEPGQAWRLPAAGRAANTYPAFSGTGTSR